MAFPHVFDRSHVCPSLYFVICMFTAQYVAGISGDTLTDECKHLVGDVEFHLSV